MDVPWPGRSNKTVKGFPWTNKEGCDGYQDSDYIYGWQPTKVYQTLIEYRSHGYLHPIGVKTLNAVRKYSTGTC